jgi:2-polyprenyl-3-methyl-5-hydroxy-6-metoxy-1,4-benzoquinol methylase
MKNKITNNKPYNQIASYYDDSTNLKIFDVYISLIGKVKNKKILDLGCGTGTLLKYYSKKNTTFGIDASPKMIEKAKTKDQKSNYKIGDIRTYQNKNKFNIITCTYDTINHLPTLNDWDLLFKNVDLHLNSDGIFFFDFSTIKGLQNSSGTIMQKIGNDYIIRKVKTEKHACRWIFHHFQKTTENLFKHKKSIINEIAFPQKDIEKRIKKYLKIIEIKKDDLNRVYIKAKKKTT